MRLDKSAEVVMSNVKRENMEERNVRVIWVIWRLYKNIKGKNIKTWST